MICYWKLLETHWCHPTGHRIPSSSNFQSIMDQLTPWLADVRPKVLQRTKESVYLIDGFIYGIFSCPTASKCVCNRENWRLWKDPIVIIIMGKEVVVIVWAKPDVILEFSLINLSWTLIKTSEINLRFSKNDINLNKLSSVYPVTLTFT